MGEQGSEPQIEVGLETKKRKRYRKREDGRTRLRATDRVLIDYTFHDFALCRIYTIVSSPIMRNLLKSVAYSVSSHHVNILKLSLSDALN
ncbi:hypothetical protein RRG08_028293 [Elysia crispata]|uniref:Uncharacterized protein n=1 Tax=Elysia crispata TaxID=231223 RepID=A0AAE1E5K8_9GAST|nr:hypothetical protein RRG08_028293 [Elysia crispata]